MVFRTNFKAFKVFFERKNFFFKIWIFLKFFAYPGSQISWKMTNFFFERYRPKIFRGLHKLCCEQILRRFGSFRARKFSFENLRFLDFFCISGVTEISWKMANYFFEKYRPEICRRLHKWCCERILRRFRLFRAKKFFFENWQFFYFFAYPGSQISWKMTNFFFESYRPKIFRELHKLCCERILRRFRSFRGKKIFSKLASFFTFFAYPGSQISWKMTNFFFERYRPKICRGLHKWCCERVLRLFRSFLAKKNFFWRLAIFWHFLHIRGPWIFWKIINEINLRHHKWCIWKIN